MIKKSFLKNLLLVSIFLMLIQIYIGTGVREIMDSAIDYLINNYENHEMLRTNVI